MHRIRAKLTALALCLCAVLALSAAANAAGSVDLPVCQGVTSLGEG